MYSYAYEKYSGLILNRFELKFSNSYINENKPNQNRNALYFIKLHHLYLYLYIYYDGETLSKRYFNL
jgi:hypothetical protein